MVKTINCAPKERKYEIYQGGSTEQIPLLLSKKRILLPCATIMKYRLGEKYSSPWMNAFVTSDLVALTPDGRIKIIFTVDNQEKITNEGEEALSLIRYDPNPHYTTSFGSIRLKQEDYNTMRGAEYHRNKLGVLERKLKDEEILNSKAWRIVARHPDEVSPEFAEDKNLLSDYLKLVKSISKADKNMGIHFGDSYKIYKTPILNILNLHGFQFTEFDLIGTDIRDVHREFEFVVRAPEISVDQVLSLGRKYISPSLYEQFEKEAGQLVQ